MLIWPSAGNRWLIQAYKEIMARNSLLPQRAAVRRAVGFLADPSFGQCTTHHSELQEALPHHPAQAMFSRWAGCWGRGTSFSTGHTKSSFICHLTQSTEMDSFWGTWIVTKFHLFPLICACTLSARQAVRDFSYRFSFFLGGRATLPALQRSVLTPPVLVPYIPFKPWLYGI